MTDRLKGVVVTFEKDIREDDAKAIIDAIKQLRNVLAVDPLVGGSEARMAENKVRSELGAKLWAVLYPSKDGTSF